MVSKGDYDDLLARLVYDHAEGKSTKDKTFEAGFTGFPGHWS
jgi:hypothetical protein